MRILVLMRNTEIASLSAAGIIFLFVLIRIKSFPFALEAAVICGLVLWIVLNIIEYQRTKQPNFDTLPIQTVLKECERYLSKIRILIDQINQLERQPKKFLIQLTEIANSLEEILEVLEEDEDKHELARAFLKNFLEPMHQWLLEYHRLSKRRIRPAQLEIEDAREKLPDIISRLKQLEENIHLRDAILLAQLSMTMETLRLDAPSQSS